MDGYSVTPDLVRHIGKLAALDLDAEEEKRFVVELNRILGHMKQLASIPTDGIEATFQTLKQVNVIREDKHEPSLSVNQVLQNAPSSEGQYIKMPPIMESES